jgi:hypothetical protein
VSLDQGCVERVDWWACTCGETRRTNKDGSVVTYLQLAHNERHPVTGVSTAKVIHNFGRAELVDREALARLVASISRLLTPDLRNERTDLAIDFAEFPRVQQTHRHPHRRAQRRQELLAVPAVVVNGDRRQAALPVQPLSILHEQVAHRHRGLTGIGRADRVHVFLLLTGGPEHHQTGTPPPAPPGLCRARYPHAAR